MQSSTHSFRSQPFVATYNCETESTSSSDLPLVPTRVTKPDPELEKTPDYREVSFIHVENYYGYNLTVYVREKWREENKNPTAKDIVSNWRIAITRSESTTSQLLSNYIGNVLRFIGLSVAVRHYIDMHPEIRNLQFAAQVYALGIPVVFAFLGGKYIAKTWLCYITLFHFAHLY